MKVLKQAWRPRRTGLVGRLREARSKGRPGIELETAADVYGYQNLFQHLKDNLGFELHMTHEGNKVFANFGQRTANIPFGRPYKHATLQRAIEALKPGKGECVSLTTPLEMHAFMGIRNILREKGISIRTARNCTAVNVWRK